MFKVSFWSLNHAGMAKFDVCLPPGTRRVSAKQVDRFEPKLTIN